MASLTLNNDKTLKRCWVPDLRRKLCWIPVVSLMMGFGLSLPGSTAAVDSSIVSEQGSDPLRLEGALQALPWPQFRKVVESIPKLRAEVDAYGAFGWEFVKRRYTTHRWEKSIRKLDDEERKTLGDLIEQVGRESP